MTDNASLAWRIATDDDVAAAATYLAPRAGSHVVGVTLIVGDGIRIAQG